MFAKAALDRSTVENPERKLALEKDRVFVFTRFGSNVRSRLKSSFFATLLINTSN